MLRSIPNNAQHRLLSVVSQGINVENTRVKQPESAPRHYNIPTLTDQQFQSNSFGRFGLSKNLVTALIAQSK